jgi:hypothetical protein
LSTKAKPEKPPLPIMNNLQVQPSAFCCGLAELGNFNYQDPEDGVKVTHYHRKGTWQSVSNAQGTTLTQVKQAIAYNPGAVLCTTGVGQEYMEPILKEAGFVHVFSYQNPGHAKTEIKMWMFAQKPLR